MCAQKEELNLNFSDRVILLLNEFTYRIDAFMSNIADFFSILTFSLLVFNFLNSLNITFEKMLFSLFIISTGAHFSYFIVYVINDFMDYDKVIKFDSLKYAFYKHRPVIYFKRRRAVILVMLFGYIGCICFVSQLFKASFMLLLPFVLLFTALSSIRSIVEGIAKFLFFSLLRFHKYLYAIILLEISLFNTVYNDITGFIVLWLITPYVMYDTIRYIRFSQPPKKFISLRKCLVVSMICLILVIFLSFFIFPSYSSWNVIKAIALGYMLLIIPHILATFLPGLIHRWEKPSFQRYLLDLLISLIITSLLCIGISYYIIMQQ